MPIGNAAEANTGSDLVVVQQNQFEIEANRAVDDVHHDQAHRRGCLSTFEAKCTIGTQLALANLLLEIPSAVLDQIASEDYVLIVMLISLTSMLVCFVELVCRGRKEKITWRCSSTGRIPWFYHPPPPSNRPFGTLTEMIGLACAIAQCIVTTINYSLYRRHHAATIKFCVWPMIFGFGMLCSKFVGKPNEDGGESRTDQDGGDVTLNQANVDQPLTPAQ
ncbi:Serine/threonine-protein kinase PBS1 [Theobroma cacao]|uniref:Serine/threonine-protein kinase PBS1 n=1 Tax=Theobroma cacao TaxID=3641 RepID=A0A061DWS7_THECC|nr:Serine/threonine-protein kinase PBS1 [Theobroma cacao]